jgi:hypothetical protein
MLHYPEVYELKNPLPFDGHGWFGHEEHFKNLLAEKKPKIAIEVGSWLGCSARSIASKLPSDGILIAVDHWKGSIEHQMDNGHTTKNYPFCMNNFYLT